MSSKENLRKILRSKLKHVNHQAVRSATVTINHRLRSVIDYSSINSILIYRAKTTWREISLADFIDWIREEYPNIELELVSQSAAAPTPDQPIDVIIMPLLSFDSHGNRLGRGAGWYDRLLGQHPDATRIGIAYSLQYVDVIPTEPHDHPLDYTITEQGTTRYR